MLQDNYSFLDLLSMEACTGCRLCADVCPAVLASGDGQVSGIYRLEELKKINQRREGLFRKFLDKQILSAENMNSFGETVFKCTLCGNCQEVCPVGIQLRDLWGCLRQDMVQMKSYPRQIDHIKDNLLKSHNVFDEDNDDRSQWVEDMDDPPEHGFIKDKVEVVYFSGCVASYFPMAQKIAISTAEILNTAKINFTLLGKEEWCCGFPLIGAGLKNQCNEIIEHNVSAVRKKEARTIIFSCPSCYQMWQEHYPPEFELLHVTEYLNRLVKNKSLRLKNLPLTVTYHDPCDLGRGARVFDAPRELIHSIPGINFIELEHNRESCRCCGGGGNLEMIDAELSAKIAGKKIDEILKTGASTVITSCQQCVRTMTGYARRNKVPLKIMDITELLKTALED